MDHNVVTFAGSLSGVHAQQFFQLCGHHRSRLWSRTNDGFTQVNLSDNPLNNYLPEDSMLFLIGTFPKQEFIQGMYAAATTTPDATYSPIANHGNPATAKAGTAFPGND